MEEEFSKLRAAHDAVVLQNVQLETELLKLKGRLAEAEEEKRKLMAAVATGGAGSSTPSLSSFSTVTRRRCSRWGSSGWRRRPPTAPT
ncbi:hypothetical protein ACP4OV_011137 [Aristida adscensionis]